MLFACVIINRKVNKKTEQYSRRNFRNTNRVVKFYSDHLFAPIWRDGVFCLLIVIFLCLVQLRNVFQSVHNYWCNYSRYTFMVMSLESLLKMRGSCNNSHPACGCQMFNIAWQFQNLEQCVPIKVYRRVNEWNWFRPKFCNPLSEMVTPYMS